MSVAELAELDVDELDELAEFCKTREQHLSWGNVGELLAKQVELTAALLARVNAGIAVRPQKKIARPPKPYEVERPPWMTAPTSEEVMTPRQFFQMMRGR